MKDKLGLVSGIGIVLAVIVTLIAWIQNSGGVDVIEYLYFGLILVIVSITSVMLWKKAKDMKAGLPVEDELATKTTWKAGYYTYLFSVWVAVSLLWYNILVPEKFGVPELTAEQVIGIFVLLPGAFFLVSALYFNKKGDV